MPELSATLLYATRDADSVSVRVELAYPGLAPWPTEYKFRSGVDLLAVNVAGFILEKAARIEALLARAAEFEAAVGQDVYPLLTDPPAPHPLLEAVLERVTASYEAVAVEVRVVFKPTGESFVKAFTAFDPAGLTREALRARLAELDEVAARLESLNAVVPALDPMRGVDLVAWARAGAPVPQE